MKERIQKLLSSQGIASRRRVEMMIREKRIIVNGFPAQIGMLVDKNDKVFIDNLIVIGMLFTSINMKKFDKFIDLNFKTFYLDVFA